MKSRNFLVGSRDALPALKVGGDGTCEWMLGINQGGTRLTLSLQKDRRFLVGKGKILSRRNWYAKQNLLYCCWYILVTAAAYGCTGNKTKIGIIQIAEHPSLTPSGKLLAELEANGFKHLKVIIDYQNAQEIRLI